MIEEQSLSRLDQAFAGFLGRMAALDSKNKMRFEAIVAELSCQQNQGHICIQLDQEEQELVHQSGLVSEQERTPLILEQNRLYLHRYWFYETRLAGQVYEMAERSIAVDEFDEALDRYFITADTETNWQREAAKKAVAHAFCIITGGPGTGKTTTVVRILALLQELSRQPLYIALAAPTGKAAMRLQESIGRNKESLPASDAIKEQIPDVASTLHRLLGVKPSSPFFRHCSENPLPYDLVVIDEASMIDLALMSKLVDALKKDARLILLGDKDQLASVESGAVLGDLTAAIPTNTLELKKSYRFDENIRKLAEVVNNQQAEQAWQILQTGTENIELLQEDPAYFASQHQAGYLELIKSGAETREILQAFNSFQVLCATRKGKNSIEEINRLVELRLAEQNRIQLSSQWYCGRPVMVTQNDPNLHLYNGDIGICLPDSDQSGRMIVCFQRPDSSIKKYLPSRLPHCETVFAMTIHKSQGSEFDEVMIALPEVMNPVLTKELIYTAITRAKQKVWMVASQAVFMATVQQRVQRYGGLAEKLSSMKDHHR